MTAPARVQLSLFDLPPTPEPETAPLPGEADHGNPAAREWWDSKWQFYDALLLKFIRRNQQETDPVKREARKRYITYLMERRNQCS